mmetsp:Transcript_45152/g.74855  ORF Transcript_45152/g.74855 Transcript_45152/m.74855 type:complete len:111 (+) Transcript_45152:748-1080(+)
MVLHIFRGATSTFSGSATIEEPLMGSSSILTTCRWDVGANDALQITAQSIMKGGRSWVPSFGKANDEMDFDQDKASRVLSKCYPIFLDDELLVLRGVLRSAIFIFIRDMQ